MVKLGEAFSEVEVEMFMVSRYVVAKREWIKWKKMMNDVSKSDMRMSTLLNLVVYRIFEEGGLWDQGNEWEKKELMAAKMFVQNAKLWDFNMVMPDNCMEVNSTMTQCDKVQSWVGPRGVSDDAATMKNFRVKNESNITLKDIDTNLDVFDKYEKEMASKENIAKSEQWAKAILLALEGDLSILINLTNGTNPFGRRVLADDDTNLDLNEVADGTAGSLDAGQDDQINEAELDDVTEIDQTAPTKDLEAIDNISDADSGTIGDDSRVDGDDGDSGTSFMTWVMYIGGAILVMALIAGACYLVMQRKDANEF